MVDKPAGLVVHPAAGNLDGTLVNALLHHCRGQLSGIGGVARPGIVHRIDKDTSGLLVVAKTDAAHEGLARQFADHSIERAYLAVCGGHPVPPAGTVRGAIARSDARPQEDGAASQEGRAASTPSRITGRSNGSTGARLIECRLETGRTHQVRVHLASIGHPLLGDPVYGRSPTRAPAAPRRGSASAARRSMPRGWASFIRSRASGSRFASKLPVDMAGTDRRIGRFDLEHAMKRSQTDRSSLSVCIESICGPAVRRLV